MNRLWQNWLTLWAWGVVLFGAVLSAGAFAATDGAARGVFALIGNPFPLVPDPHHRFAVGLMGAVSIGWGLTYLVLFKALNGLDLARAAPLWRAALVASAAWFVIDSAISIATGFGLNAVSNCLLMVLLLVPLVRSGALRG